MDFVDRLLEYMKKNNLKENDIAKLSGLSRGAISDIVSRNRGANDKLLQALSKHSGRSVNWWLEGCEDYDNLYSLNKLIDLFIEDGSIEEDGSMSEEIWQVLCTMLKKEINVKIKKATQK